VWRPSASPLTSDGAAVRQRGWQRFGPHSAQRLCVCLCFRVKGARGFPSRGLAQSGRVAAGKHASSLAGRHPV
jgi:hypothetical protein